MTDWTPDATRHLEHYLKGVRRSLKRRRDVDANDVTDDLRAHVHAELAGSDEPVTLPRLEAVLATLGPPTQWDETAAGADDAARPWYRRSIDWTGLFEQATGDSAMPLLLFALTLAALFTLHMGVGLLFLAVAYVVARRALKQSPEMFHGPRWWLASAPLVLVSGTLAGLVVIFPFLLFGQPHPQEHPMVAWVMGLWWIVLAHGLRRDLARVRTVLAPFGDALEPSQTRVLTMLGVCLVVLGVVLAAT